MQSKEAKELIKKILGEQIKIDHYFNKQFNNLKETRQESLIQWIKDCQTKKNNPNLLTREFLIFILKLRDTRYRAILTKKKNADFTALYLMPHKYYMTTIEKLKKLK